jgi:hypothetical protein
MQDQESNRITRNLEQRIETVEALGDAELGSFTSLDWLLCIAGSVVIPALLLWWFAP